MQTKYPIILVHGVIIKDFRFFKAFGRIERVLRANDYLVYTAKIDGIGTSQTNALELKEYINKIIAETKCKKVNLISHSKGGLDSKYMIESLDMEDKVASLITLSTPYKGSPIATTILKLPRPIIWCVKTWFNVAYKIFGDRYPNSLEVCKELSLVDSINTECLRLKNVYVESYSTTLTKSRDDFIMGIPHAFCRYFYKEKETDGLVSKESAKFINYKGDITDASLSHTDIVDFMVGKKKKEKIYEFYLDLCGNLSKMGF